MIKEGTSCSVGMAQTACCWSSFTLEQEDKAMKPDIPSVPSCLRHLMSLQSHLLLFLDQAGCDLGEATAF